MQYIIDNRIMSETEHRQYQAEVFKNRRMQADEEEYQIRIFKEVNQNGITNDRLRNLLYDRFYADALKKLGSSKIGKELTSMRATRLSSRIMVEIAIRQSGLYDTRGISSSTLQEELFT